VEIKLYFVGLIAINFAASGIGSLRARLSKGKCNALENLKEPFSSGNKTPRF